MSKLTSEQIEEVKQRLDEFSHMGGGAIIKPRRAGELLMRFGRVDVPNLLDTIDAKDQRIKALEAKVTAIDILMAESTGVVGWHFNGEIATWEWLIDNWDDLTIEEAQDGID